MVSITPQLSGGVLSPDNLNRLRSQGMDDDKIADLMAQSSPHFKDQLSKIRSKFGSDPSATKAFLNMRFYGTTDYSPEPQADKSLWTAPKRIVDNLFDTVHQGIVNTEQNLEDYNTGKKGLANTAASQFGNNLSTLASGGTALMNTALETKLPVVNASVNDAAGAAINALGQTKLGKAAYPVIGNAVQSYQQASENSPTLQSVNSIAKGAFDVANMVGVGKAGEEPFQAVKSVATHPIQTIQDAGSAGIGAALHPIQTVKNVRSAFSAPGTAATEVPNELSILAKAGQKAGIDERVTKLLQDATPEDRAMMQTTLQRYQEGAKDFSATSPKEVAGDTILQRVRHLQPVQQEIGKRIGAIVGAAAEEPVSIDNTFRKFMTTLTDKGVYVAEDGKLASDAGAIPKADLSFLQQIYDRINPSGTVKNFKDGHLTRQWLFDEQNLAKARMAGYSDKAQAIAGDVHSNLLQDLSVRHPQYGILAQPYAEVKQSVDSFAKLLGKNSSEELTARSLKAGEVARRVLGNSSADIKTILDKLEEAARKYGFTGKTSIDRQVRFADSLSQYFPTSATASLEGGVEKGVVKAIGTMAKLKTGNAVGAATDVLQAVMGKSPEKQLKIIENMLKVNAESLAAAKTPEEVSALIDKIINTEDSVDVTTKKPLVDMSNNLGETLQERKIKNNPTNTSDIGSINIEDNAKVTKIPKELEPLAAEARKYKNANDFAKDVRMVSAKKDGYRNAEDTWVTGEFRTPDSELTNSQLLLRSLLHDTSPNNANAIRSLGISSVEDFYRLVKQ